MFVESDVNGEKKTSLSEGECATGRNTCPWDSTEINVLRSVFQETKNENLQLKATLKVAEDELCQLRKLCGEQSQKLHSQSAHLHEARKANERFQILATNLKSRLKEAWRKNKVLKTEINAAKEIQSKNLVEMRDLRIESNTEQVSRMQLEIELKHQKYRSEQDEERRTAMLKAHYEHDLADQQGACDRLTLELKEEKDTHHRYKKGLDHMRKHFSRLPLSISADDAHAELNGYMASTCQTTVTPY